MDPKRRLCLAVSQLVRGETSVAREALQALADESPDRESYHWFAELAAAVAGDGAAANRLTESDSKPFPLTPFYFLLELRKELTNYDFPRAAGRIRTWLASPRHLDDLGLSRCQMNLLSAFCLMRGTPRRKRRVVDLLEKLHAEGRPGWELPLLFARQLLVTHNDLMQAGAVDSQQLIELDEAYGQYFAKELDLEERDAAERLRVDLLYFMLAHHVGRQEVMAAQRCLARLPRRRPEASEVLEELERALTKQTADPSHPQAYALLDTEPEAARGLWSRLLEDDPDDLIAIHHLACLAWCRGYDTYAAGKFDNARRFFKEGLLTFRRLYAQEDYWQQQREKGQALASPGYPFSEPAFMAWRQDAFYHLCCSLLRLICRLMVGTDPTTNHGGEAASLRAARILMRIFHEVGLEPEMLERISIALAKSRLDPDPTKVRDYNAAVLRAQQILAVDPGNISARRFLVRAASHHVNAEKEAGERSATILTGCLNAQAEHADWLTKELSHLNDPQRTLVINELIYYHNQVAVMRHREGQEEAQRYNAERELTRARAVVFMRRIRQHYRASDDALHRSLALQGFNMEARQMLAYHSKEYERIESILALQDLRKICDYSSLMVREE